MDHLPKPSIGPDEEVPGWAIRLEAKVDVALTRHGAALETLARDIVTVRAEGDRRDTQIEHLDKRLDQVERTPVVTPKGLAATVVTTVTGVAAFIALIDRLTI